MLLEKAWLALIESKAGLEWSWGIRRVFTHVTGTSGLTVRLADIPALPWLPWLQCYHGYNVTMVTMLQWLQCNNGYHGYHGYNVTMVTMVTLLPWLQCYSVTMLVQCHNSLQCYILLQFVTVLHCYNLLQCYIGPYAQTAQLL